VLNRIMISVCVGMLVMTATSNKAQDVPLKDIVAYDLTPRQEHDLTPTPAPMRDLTPEPKPEPRMERSVLVQKPVQATACQVSNTRRYVQRRVLFPRLRNAFSGRRCFSRRR
jgi:hypothetical protein